MNQKLLDALGELFVEGSPLYLDAKGLMELAVQEEREQCAAIVDEVYRANGSAYEAARQIRNRGLS